MDYVVIIAAVIGVIFLIQRYNRNRPDDEKPNKLNNIFGVVVVGFIILVLLRSCSSPVDNNDFQQENKTTQ